MFKLIVITILIVLGFVSCSRKLDKISYTINWSDTFKGDEKSFSRSDFINYGDYTFEFLLLHKSETDVYTKSEKMIIKESYDTLEVFVYDLKNKIFHKVWPFNKKFQIVAQNQPLANKNNGFGIAGFINDSTTKREKFPIDSFKIETTQMLERMKLFYLELKDSIANSKFYFVKKRFFNSPYDFNCPAYSDIYSFVGYVSTIKNGGYGSKQMISDIKPLPDSTRELCKRMIHAIKQKASTN
jgi:hypothetical protein